MARYNIRPYDDYKAWDTAETIEEARAKNERYALNIGNTSDKKTFLLENEDKFKGYHNCSHEH